MPQSLFKKFNEFITHNETIVVFLIILASLVEYLFNVGLARLLEPADYGDISVALTVAMFWSIIAELGATKAIQKYLPRYYELGKLNLAKGLLIFYLLLSVAIALLLAMLTTLIVYLDYQYFHIVGSNQSNFIFSFLHRLDTSQHAAIIDIPYIHKVATTQYHPVILAFWIVPLIVFSSILSAVLKSFDHFVLSIFPNLVLLYCIALPLFWICSLMGFPITDWNLLGLFGLAYLLVCVLQLILTYYFLPRDIVASQAHYSMPKWIKLSIPLMFSTLFFIALKQINFVMVEVFDTSEAAVGYFAAAQKVSGFILMFYLGMNVVYVPLASRILLQKNAVVRKFLADSTKKVFYICFPMLLTVIIFGNFFLGLFGPEYVTAYWPTVILALGTFTNALLGYHLIMLQYANRQYTVLSIQIACLILNIALCWLLIPLWGITGAAVANSASLIAMSFIITLLSMRKFSHDLPAVETPSIATP